MCVGLKGKAGLGLDKGPSSFWYLAQSGTYTVSGVKDEDAFKASPPHHLSAEAAGPTARAHPPAPVLRPARAHPPARARLHRS